MNFLSFCSSENVLISSFLKDTFATYRIFGWQVFFFQHLKYPTHFLPLWVLMRNQQLILIGDPFYVKSCFSSAAFKYLWLWLLTLWICVLVWAFLNLSYLDFIELLRCVDSRLSSNLVFSTIISLNILLTPFSLFLLEVP